MPARRLATSAASSALTRPRRCPTSWRRRSTASGAPPTRSALCATQLRDDQTAARVGTFLDSADAAAQAVTAAAADVPAMVDSIDAAATSFDQFDFAGVAADLKAALADIRGVIGTEMARALPGKLASAVDTLGRAAADVGGIAADLNAGEIGTKVTTFVDQASAAAEAVRLAAADVPGMVDQGRRGRGIGRRIRLCRDQPVRQRPDRGSAPDAGHRRRRAAAAQPVRHAEIRVGPAERPARRRRGDQPERGVGIRPPRHGRGRPRGQHPAPAVQPLPAAGGARRSRDFVLRGSRRLQHRTGQHVAQPAPRGRELSAACPPQSSATHAPSSWDVNHAPSSSFP